MAAEELPPYDNPPPERREWERGGGDHDQPFHYGARPPSMFNTWPFDLHSFVRLVLLRNRVRDCDPEFVGEYAPTED